MSMLGKLFSKKIDKNQFANLVAKAMEDAGFSVFHYDEENFALKLSNGSTTFLDNVFANWQSTANHERDALIEKFVAGVTARPAIPSSFDAVRKNLIPIVRSASYFSLQALLSKSQREYKPDRAIPTRALVGEIVVGLAYDAANSFSIIPDKDFSQWGVNLDEAIDVATENLQQITDANQLVEVSPGLYIGEWGDSYESSRILLTGLVKTVQLEGIPVVGIPSRNHFCLTWSNNRDGLAALVQLLEETHFEAYPLSANLYALQEHGWNAFFPEDEALCQSLTNIQRRRFALDYGLQKQYLEVIHQQENIDIFVASFATYETVDTKETFSVCVWSKDVDSILPRSDRIIFLIDSETTDRVNVAWDIAESVVGHLMEKQSDLVPERYRVRSFPSDTEIAELKRRVSAQI